MTKQIEFEDIRKGDLIRVQHKARHGVRATHKGVASELLYGDVWVTDEGGLLAFKDDAESIALLERPEPQEPVGVGVVVETEDRIRFVSIHPNTRGRRWVRLWWTGRGTSDHATVWAWDALVRAYGSISVVREEV